MKLELIAKPGFDIEAVLAQEIRPRQTETAIKLADRLFGVDRVHYDGELSYRWGCSVYCTEAFSTWWRAREGEPAAVDRHFLEVHHA